MAYVFQLSLECGCDKQNAVNIQSHFHDFVFDLNDGETVRCGPSDPTPGDDGMWWIEVDPSIKGRGLVYDADRQLMADIGRKMYVRLETAKGYRFALAGIETFQFNTAESLRKLHGHETLNGLVVSDELLKTFEDLTGFEPFAPGYCWRPFPNNWVPV
jgi:hypothetical protein